MEEVEGQEQEEKNHFHNGGVFVVAGHNDVRERLEKTMKCKIEEVKLEWEVEYEFRRSDHEKGEFEATDIELVDREEIFDHFGEASVKLNDVELDSEELSKIIDYDETASSAEGKVMLKVFRKDPWTEQEMEKFGLTF
jgi:hypothetical protein